MMKPGNPGGDDQRFGWLACMAAFAAGWAITGCNQGSYRASSLPAQYASPARAQANRLDLSQISRKTSGSQIIQSGDFLRVSIGTGYEAETPQPVSLRVAEDGSVNVPLIGPVLVAGLEPRQADVRIRQVGIQRQIYRNPQVAVEIAEKQTNQVLVTGAVEEPGVYQLPTVDSDLLSAIVAAGGLTDDAETIVEIRRPPLVNGPNVALAGYNGGAPGQATSQARIEKVDLEEAVRQGVGGFYLEDNSVVNIERRRSQTVFVMGLVQRADQFEIPPDGELRLLDAIAMAGGRKMEIADSVKIVRKIPGNRTPVIIMASVSEAKKNGKGNLQLAPGDVVTVEETPLTFTYDFIRNFARLGLSSALF